MPCRNPEASSFLEEEPRLSRVIEDCRTILNAKEVWLFGSRARRENHPDSDWDVLAVLDDDTEDSALDPMKWWEIKRASGLYMDLIASRQTDFEEAKDVVTTLSHQIYEDGVRLYG